MILFCSCKKTQQTQVKLQNEKDAQEFDISRYILLEENSSGGYDTIDKVERIPRTNLIFNKKTKYLYFSFYLDKNGDTLSSGEVLVVPTEERWTNEPEMQESIIVKYSTLFSNKQEFEKRNANIKLERWNDEIETGVIENERKLWMHPFRENEFVYTEICPFPMVQLPLKIDNTWKTTLNIGNGWGIWSNKQIKKSYKCIGQEAFFLKNEKVECWKIQAESDFDLGVSKLDYLYNENIGFVKMDYHIYNGDKIHFQLREVQKTIK